MLGDGEVNVWSKVGNVVDRGLKSRAVDGRGGVAVHAVPTYGIKIGVVGFVWVVFPAVGGADVARWINGDRVVFEIVEDVLVGPVAQEEEGCGLSWSGVNVAGEGDMAFDEVGVGGFVAVEDGVPGEVEMAGWALEDVVEAAEVVAG